MTPVGFMTMPADFRYRSVFLRGKPRHGAQDAFTLRHPAMDCGRRAKIFSPYDALKGFSDAVAAKDVRYIDRPVLPEEERQEIGRRLNDLAGLTQNGRLARENRVRVTVAYFVPCADPHHDAYGRGGQRATLTGICRRVDPIGRTLTVGETAIPFDNLLRIEADIDSPGGEGGRA